MKWDASFAAIILVLAALLFGGNVLISIILERKRNRKRTGTAGKTDTLGAFVAFSIACCIIYTIVSQVIACRTKMELSTLTTCFFATFGGEILSCALIKIFKLKEDDKDSCGDDFENDSDSYHSVD